MEIWKNIKGYEGIYQISSCGRIKNITNGRIIKQHLNKGYCIIGLHKDGNAKNFSVHRLVAEAFIPNPNSLPQINHKDENKENNSVDNLEWCTCLYNNNYGTRNKRISEYVKANHPSKYGKTCKKPVLQIDKKTGDVIRKYESVSEAAVKNGFHQGNISWCCTGKRSEANGYIWRYA